MDPEQQGAATNDIGGRIGGPLARTVAISAFFTVVSGAALFLVGQWLVGKLTQGGARMDIGEWPFVIVGAALALLPMVAALGLATGRRFGLPLAKVSAWLIGVVGAMALAIGLSFLSIGIAWTPLLGGAFLLAGAAWVGWSLRRTPG